MKTTLWKFGRFLRVSNLYCLSLAIVQSDKGEAAGILSPTVKVLEWDKGGRGRGIWTDNWQGESESGEWDDSQLAPARQMAGPSTDC